MMVANLLLALRLVWAAGMGLAALGAAGIGPPRRWLLNSASWGVPAAILLQQYRWLLGGREIIEAAVAIGLVALFAALLTRRGWQSPLLWGAFGFLLPQAALWDLFEWPFSLAPLPTGVGSFINGRFLGESGGVALGFSAALAGLWLLGRLGQIWSEQERRRLAVGVASLYVLKHMVVLAQVLITQTGWDPGILFDPLVTAFNLLPYWSDVTLTLGLLGSLYGVLRLLRHREPVAEANPALARKQMAARLHERRFALAGSLFLTACVYFASVQQWSASHAISESPPKAVTAPDGQIRVPLAELADDHLHRYVYTTEKGVEVRFAAIHQTGNRYGLGLDYCEICGPTGYAEKDGVLICKRCGSAISHMTVGFHGGCNPLPVAGKVQGDFLVIEKAELEQHQVHFAPGSHG